MDATLNRPTWTRIHRDTGELANEELVLNI
jgi:hypothetical protein